MKRKLKFMPYAQAYVEFEKNGEITLVSYKTPVATIRDNCLYIDDLYSTTTRKHIKAFLKEFVPFEMDFESIKYLAWKYIKLDLETGELIPMENGR